MIVIIMAKILTMVNLFLCIFLFLKKRNINSPFQFFFLTLAGIVVWPSLFDPINAIIDFHVFADPIYLGTYDFVKVQLIVSTYLVIFVVLELFFWEQKTISLVGSGEKLNFELFLPFAFLIFVLIYAVLKAVSYTHLTLPTICSV